MTRAWATQGARECTDSLLAISTVAAAATVLSRQKLRACFNGLCDRLREELERNPCVHDVLSVELQVVLNLYYLAGTSEYRTIRNLFGIAKFTVCECVQRVCSAIEDQLFSTYVKIPEGEAINEVIDGYKKFGFSNCGGATDGTHITITAPKDHRADISKPMSRE